MYQTWRNVNNCAFIALSLKPSSDMIRHLNRLYCLIYLGVVLALTILGKMLIGLRWDNALIASLGLVVFVIFGAHAVFHAGAFVLSHNVRKLPQIREKGYSFQLDSGVPTPTMSYWDWVKAVWAESVDTFALTMFHQPWSKHITGIKFGDKQWRKNKPLPVLLVHGYLCNAGVWVTTRERLQHQGVTTHAITLEPAIGSIRQYASSIHEAIDELLATTGAPSVKVLCHSMGGVAIRYYATVYGHDKIDSVMTLGSPHFGTSLSLLGIGKNVKQMAWGGYFLRRLREHPIDAEFQRKITSLWTPHDTIVSPPESSILELAQNHMVQGCGHMRLVTHEATIAMMTEWLNVGSCEYSAPPKQDTVAIGNT